MVGLDLVEMDGGEGGWVWWILDVMDLESLEAGHGDFGQPSKCVLDRSVLTFFSLPPVALLAGN